MDKSFDLLGIENDVDAIEKTFSRLEYKVEKLINKDACSLKNDINKFLKTIDKNDIVVVYYTGHGFYENGHNKICCSDYSNSSFIPKGIYDLNNITDYEFCNSKVLLVCDMCRKNESCDSIVEPERSKSTYENNTISQLYATSLGNYSYNNHNFCNAFCGASLRYMNTISQICESVMQEVKKRASNNSMQDIVHIQGACEGTFYLSSKMNREVESEYYNNIISIYTEFYLKNRELGDLRKNSSGEIFDEFYELSDISFPKTYVTQIIDDYFLKNNKYGFISCLMRLPIHSIRIMEKEFYIKGYNGVFGFANDELYDYNSCKQLFDKDANEIVCGIKMLSDHVFYITYNDCFLLRIENAKTKELSSYVHHKNKEIEIKEIFKNNTSIIISANLTTDSIGFLQTVVDKLIPHQDRILFIRLMERLNVENEIDYLQIIDFIHTNKSIIDYCKGRIIKGDYKNMIVSLNSALMAIDKGINQLKLNRLIEVIELANSKGIRIILVTNFLEDAFNAFPLVSTFLKYVRHIIVLESSQALGDTFVSCIKENASFNVNFFDT